MATKLAEAFVEIKVKTSGVSSKLGTVQKGMTKTGGAAKAATKQVAGLGSSFSALGKVASIAGGIVASAFILRITAGIASIIPTFAKFESTMVRVGGVTNTLATRDFAMLEAAAKKAGATTRFTATESAGAMEALGLAGLTTREIMASLPGALQLASAAQIDIATSASIAAKTMKAFGLEATDIGRINDTLVSTFTRSNTTILQLAEALKPVGPVAKAAGVSLEDTSAVLAKMADAGFSGSLGGTALRNALIRLASPSTKAARILKDLGVDSVDPLFTKLEKLQAGIEGAAGETEKLQIASEVFGIRGGPAMLAVLDSGVMSLRDFSAELKDAGGIAERLEQAQLKTLTGQFDLMRSAIEGAVLEIGEAMNPVLMVMVKIFQDIGPNIIRAIAIMSAFALGIAAVTTATWLFTSATIANTAAKITQMAFSGPAGWVQIAVGIGIATAAIVAMTGALDGAGDKAKKAAAEIKKVKGPGGAGGKPGGFKTVGDFSAPSKINTLMKVEADVPTSVQGLIDFRKDAKNKGIKVGFDLGETRKALDETMLSLRALGRSGEEYDKAEASIQKLNVAAFGYRDELRAITFSEQSGVTNAKTGAEERIAAQKKYNAVLAETRDGLAAYGVAAGVLATPEQIAAGEKLTKAMGDGVSPTAALANELAKLKAMSDVGVIGFNALELGTKNAMDKFDEAIGGPEESLEKMRKQIALVGASAKDKFLAPFIESFAASGMSVEDQTKKLSELGSTFETLEAAKEAAKKQKVKAKDPEKEKKMSFTGIAQLSQQIQANVGMSKEQKEARKTAKNTESIAKSSKASEESLAVIAGQRPGGLA